MSAAAGGGGSAGLGRLRIYLGYAPGAGTTCALLGEGRRLAERGAGLDIHIITCTPAGGLR